MIDVVAGADLAAAVAVVVADDETAAAVDSELDAVIATVAVRRAAGEHGAGAVGDDVLAETGASVYPVVPGARGVAVDRARISRDLVAARSPENDVVATPGGVASRWRRCRLSMRSSPRPP